MPSNNTFPPAGASDPVLKSSIRFSYPEDMPLDDSENSKIQRAHWLMCKAGEISTTDIKRAPLALRYLCEALYQRTGRRDFIFRKGTADVSRELEFPALTSEIASRASEIFRQCSLQKCPPKRIFSKDLIKGNWSAVPEIASFVNDGHYKNIFEPFYLYTKYFEHAWEYILGRRGKIFKDLYSAAAGRRLKIDATTFTDGEYVDDGAIREYFEIANKDSSEFWNENPSKARRTAIYTAQNLKKRLYKGKITITNRNGNTGNFNRNHTFNQLAADFYIRVGKFRAAQIYLSAEGGDPRAIRAVNDLPKAPDIDHKHFECALAEAERTSPLRIYKYGSDYAHWRNEDSQKKIREFLELQYASQDYRSAFEFFIPSEQLDKAKCQSTFDRIFVKLPHIVDMAYFGKLEHVRALRDELKQPFNYNDYDSKLMFATASYLIDPETQTKHSGRIGPSKTVLNDICSVQSRSGANALLAFLQLKSLQYTKAEQTAKKAIEICKGQNLDEPDIVTKRNLRFAALVESCAKEQKCPLPGNTAEASLLGINKDAVDKRTGRVIPALLTMPSECFLCEFEHKTKEANIPIIQEPLPEHISYSELLSARLGRDQDPQTQKLFRSQLHEQRHEMRQKLREIAKGLGQEPQAPAKFRHDLQKKGKK